MIHWMSIWTWASWQWKQDKKTHTRERSLWLEKIEIDGITFHSFNHCIRYNNELNLRLIYIAFSFVLVLSWWMFCHSRPISIATTNSWSSEKEEAEWCCSQWQQHSDIDCSAPCDDEFTKFKFHLLDAVISHIIDNIASAFIITSSQSLQ